MLDLMMLDPTGLTKIIGKSNTIPRIKNGIPK
jgi:hypothetical protein